MTEQEFIDALAKETGVTATKADFYPDTPSLVLWNGDSSMGFGLPGPEFDPAQAFDAACAWLRAASS